MADNLIFPIGFDLDSAVKKATKDWDDTYASRLEKAIQKRALAVKLKLDTSKLDNLDAVRQRLAQLKIEPITPETKTAIRDLARELQTLAKALEQVQKYSARAGGTPEAVRNSKIAANEAKAAAANELARQRAARTALAEEKLAQARDKAARAAVRGSAATRDANREYANQLSYLQRLTQRMAAYWSIRQASGALSNIRDVTAEFELQKVSLGAIIQDQTRANALFSEIKSFALKSPASILDLTKYTKQLAAYKIGADELFETTKKLTDVSVGLGVSMDRVVLAYGQVRATGHLRASEIRQFTEMGVPIVEELAAKLSKMNGELVTASQVMDMVSKRAISFEMVKEVFDDMTSAGGMFYNMQEKQGNTLFGLWAKLGDAVSVMYDEIGNTDWVNEGLKGTIELLTDLMKNWREVGRTMAAAGAGFAAIWATKKVKGWQGGIVDERKSANSKLTAAQNAYNLALQNEAAALKRETALTQNSTNAAKANAMARASQATAARISAKASLDAAFAESRAAAATTIWSKAWNKLKAAFMANWWMAAIAGIAALVTHFINANEKANRLKNTLKEIEEESGIEQMKSVRNFESLANMAVQAADGSRKQKEALDELNRTYGEIIPQERLTIENLRNMKGNYDSLTQSIKDYVAQQMKQKQINAIIESTGSVMIEQSKKFGEEMEDVWSTEQIARFMAEYERILRDNPMLIASSAYQEAARNVGIDLGKAFEGKSYHVIRYLNKFGDELKKQVTQTNALESAWNNNYAALGKYGNGYEELANKVKENPIEMGGNAEFDENKTPYFYKQQQQNLEILKTMIPTLQKIMSDANVVWQDGWANMVSTIDTASPQIISSINFDAINKYLQDNINVLTDEQRKAVAKLQEMYLNMGIPDDVVRYNRQVAIDLANSMSDELSKIGDESKTAVDKISKYLMDSGQSVNDYAKFLEDELEAVIARIGELAPTPVLIRSAETVEELAGLQVFKKFLEDLRSSISKGVTLPSGGTPSDNRLSQLREIEQTLTTINSKYEELLKKEGQTKALADIQKIYGDTLKYINKLGGKFKLNFAMPTEFKTLQEYRKAIQDVIEKLKMKGYEKEALELQTKIDTGDVDKLGKEVESKIKELADRISRTKTAREFYDKVLGMTGDYELAGKVAFSIYGSDGDDLKQQLAKQIRELSNGIELPDGIISADNIVDYKALREWAELNKDELGKTYDELVKIAEQGQKDLAKTYEGYLKDLEKAKSYSDKRIELARYTANKIAEINASPLPQEEKKRLTAGYNEREDKEAAKLEYEAFKDLPIYTQMFDDLEHASTSTLTNMRDKLMQMQDQWKDLDPTQLKELQSRLNEVETQLASRNPFKTLSDSIKEYKELQRTHGSESKLNKEIDVATDAYIRAKAELEEQLASNPDDKEAVENLQKRVDLSKEELKQLQKIAAAYKRVKDLIGLSLGEVSQIAHSLGDLASGIGKMTEVFGGSEEDVQYWNDIADGLNEVTSGIENVVKAALSGNPVAFVSSVITAVPNIISGFSTLFSAGKIRRANKEIKRQQELLDQLEYTYSRLEKAADKLFGIDYINNYNQRVKNLEAQAEAYKKQAEAERSKGKKADKEKIKEFENAYRDTMDEIADMEAELTAKFVGSSRTDLARDFAQSWLEAKASFASTTDAIKSKYKDMIQSMIVEGAAAKVIDNILAPMWDRMNKMLGENNITGAIDYLVNGMDAFVQQADDGLNVLWKSLEAKGYDMKKLLGDMSGNEYTGISRDIATASEESINGLAAHMNTVEHYVAMIQRDVAAMVSGSGAAAGKAAAPSVDYTSLIQQSLANQSMIVRNTAETVAECRNIAAKCQAQTDLISKVIVPSGVRGTHQIYVGM